MLLKICCKLLFKLMVSSKTPFLPFKGPLTSHFAIIFLLCHSQKLSIREGTFFLEGRAREFWYFFQKKSVCPPLSFNKKLLTPPPLLKVTDKSATLPSLLHGMFHAIETSEHFVCERKMFDYKYISILNVCELKQENANNQCGIFKFYS